MSGGGSIATESEFVEVDFHTSNELLTVILARSHMLDAISAVEHEDIPNISKGVVAIRMKVYGTKICFINAHLQYGQSKQ